MEKLHLNAPAKSHLLVHSLTCLVLASVVACALFAGPTSAQPNRSYRVLVLHSYHQGFAWTDYVMEGIQTIVDESDLEIELFVEYMDTKRHKAQELFPYLEEMYRFKYHDVQFDAIILSDNNALTFALSVRDELFPGVPIVFCGINNLDDAPIEGETGITGVAEDIDMRGTIELALQLHPQTRQIAVISDNTPTGGINLELARAVMPGFEDRVEFVELAGLSAEEVQEAVVRLPDDALILHLSFYQDRTGRAFSTQEGHSLVTEITALPVYSCWDYTIANGVLGGVVTSGRLQGQNAAQMALRILRGGPAESIPVLRESPNVPMFDYTVMKQVGIAVSDLPGNSVILNEQVSFYARYKSLIHATLAVILLQTLTIVALGMNVARRRRVEAELRKHRDHLEELVAARTAELAAKNAELEQFAYVVSHDLRAPLRAIHNYADFLREDLEATLQGEQKMYLDGMGRAVHEAEELIEDLLQLSRLERHSIEMQRIDLGAFLRELVAALALPGEVEVVMAEDWPTVEVEPTLLRQIFQNLIENAVKFNDAPRKRVELGWQAVDGEGYEIHVRDNGIGIEPRYHEQIFGVFERLHAREAYEGTGIGLAIVKKAAEKLGGAVRVESEVGRGATFYFTLPEE